MGPADWGYATGQFKGSGVGCKNQEGHMPSESGKGRKRQLLGGRDFIALAYSSTKGTSRA